MSVRNLEYRSHFATDVINVTWKIEDLYKQTTIGESRASSTSSSSVAVAVANTLPATSSAAGGGRNRQTTSKTGRSPQKLPSTKEVILLEVDGKPSSGNKDGPLPKWIFSLRFNGGETGEWLVSLDRKPSAPNDDDPVIVQVTMKILDADGSEFWTDSDSGPFWVHNQPEAVCNYCGHYNYRCTCSSGRCSECCGNCRRKPKTSANATGVKIKTWSIGNALEVHDVLVNGSLTIYIRLEQFERSSPCVRSTKSAIEVGGGGGGGEKQLARDFGDLRKYGYGTNYDLKLKTSGGVKIFRTHKCILAARSAFFRRMFGEGLSDDHGEGELSGEISSDAVEILLDYIYTGSLNLDLNGNTSVPKEKLVTELMYRAKRWELAEFKQLIASHLVACCDRNNAVKILEIARQNEMPAAVEDIKMFIRNNIDDILAEYDSSPSSAATASSSQGPKEKRLEN